MTAAALSHVSAGLPMAGLLLARQLQPPRPTIESLILIWSASEAEEYRDRVVFLPL